MIKRSLAALAVSLLAAFGVMGTGSGPAFAGRGPVPHPVPSHLSQAGAKSKLTTCAPLCYYYVVGSEARPLGEQGMAWSMDVVKPTMNTANGDLHTLMEGTVQDGNGNIIELGWNVDPANPDNNPRLFTFWWKNNVPQGYNVNVTNCGGAVTSPTATPGGLLTFPAFPAWGIFHDAPSSMWWLKYGTGWVGCFPDSLWAGTFTSGTFFQGFGEVASTRDDAAGNHPCAMMGSGTKGSLKNTVTPNAVRFGNTAYYLNTTYTVNFFQRAQPVTSYYDVGTVNTRSFYLGGDNTTC